MHRDRKRLSLLLLIVFAFAFQASAQQLSEPGLLERDVVVRRHSVEAGHRMTGLEQALCEVKADEARRAGTQELHVCGRPPCPPWHHKVDKLFNNMAPRRPRLPVCTHWLTRSRARNKMSGT